MRTTFKIKSGVSISLERLRDRDESSVLILFDRAVRTVELTRDESTHVAALLTQGDDLVTTACAKRVGRKKGSGSSEGLHTRADAEDYAASGSGVLTIEGKGEDLNA